MKIPFDFRHPGPPITSLELAEMERMHSMRLPADFQRFLLSMNGGYPEHECFLYEGGRSFTVQRFYPLASDDGYHVCVFRDAYGEPVSDLLEIGRSHFGDPLCLVIGDTHFGSVWWYDHEHDPDEDPHDGLTFLSPNFESFIAGLKPL